MPVTAAPAVWDPFPVEAWDEAAARHLLRRIGWTATAADVARAQQEGLAATLDRHFPQRLAELPEPVSIAKLRGYLEEIAPKARNASEQDRRQIFREAREHMRQAQLDLSLQWLQFAAGPQNSAAEKWVSFLSNVYVVGAVKVHDASQLYDHQAVLRRFAFAPAPLLTKAVSQSPAMVMYLDLQQSQREAPNENFARELLELFVLGEGHYTERDIKEAARAFTGYRQRLGRFYFIPRQHDPSTKTVFGHTGRYYGDDVIDLAYTQPSAAWNLPQRMARYYLSEAGLTEQDLAALGDWWRRTGFDLHQLVRHFFGSRLFFAPQYRGNYIKSPVQFYLGALQDLQLDVMPLPRFTLIPLQQMGQALFDPPNVRGWVGGRTWINSVTLAARRQLVRELFNPLDPMRLNADEQRDLATAANAGHGRFNMAGEELRQYFPAADAAANARSLAASFLPVPVSPDYLATLAAALHSAGPPAVTLNRERLVLEAVLQTPEYQLC
ncbi:MAG: DUF1800 family protein [Opitutales bacterium]